MDPNTPLLRKNILTKHNNAGELPRAAPHFSSQCQKKFSWHLPLLLPSLSSPKFHIGEHFSCEPQKSPSAACSALLVAGKSTANPTALKHQIPQQQLSHPSPVHASRLIYTLEQPLASEACAGFDLLGRVGRELAGGGRDQEAAPRDQRRARRCAQGRKEFKELPLHNIQRGEVVLRGAEQVTHVCL